MRRPAVRQFVKFCIVGAGSTVIDVGILYWLTQKIGLHWIPAQVISFAVAVSNGFLWNSIWTFRDLGSGARHHQYLRFVGVNVVGLGLTLTIEKAVLIALTGHLIYHGNPPAVDIYMAKAVAIVLVTTWNFLANKHWTFRGPRGPNA